MRVTYMTSVNHTLAPNATVLLHAYNFAPNPRKPAQTLAFAHKTSRKFGLANMYRQNRPDADSFGGFRPQPERDRGTRDVDPGSSRNVAPRGRSKNRASPLHQRRHMRGHRARQGVEVVAAFQHRDDAAAAAPLSDFHQAPRHPGIVRLDEIEVAERIAAVGIEARRDDDEIRREVGDARQDRNFHGLAEDLAPVTGAQGGVDDLIVLAAVPYLPRARKEWHFVRRGVHDGSVIPKDVLRAVTVMDVEIDDRDALGAIDRLGVTRGNGSVVEETESHWRRDFRMMARRARGDEGVSDLAGHHLVDSEYRAPR